MPRPLANKIPEELLSILRYEPGTGLLFWVRPPRRGIRAGTQAGKYAKGSLRVTYKGVSYGAHRIAWSIYYGSIPQDMDIDHKDTNPDNNRIENLRLATAAQNRANVAVSKRSVTGLKGAQWRPDRKKWSSRIAVDGKIKHLGYFNSPEEAHQAYMLELINARGVFARAE